MPHKKNTTGNGSLSHIRYLPCLVEPGMFEGEWLVFLQVQDTEGKPVRTQMLVDQNEVHFVGTPRRGRPVQGWLRVQTVGRKKGGYVSVVLPQPAEPVGETICVAEGLLQEEIGA